MDQTGFKFPTILADAPNVRRLDLPLARKYASPHPAREPCPIKTASPFHNGPRRAARRAVGNC